MIAHDDLLLASALSGAVRIFAAQALPLAALYLGAAGRPSWAQVRAIGPVHFEAVLPDDAQGLARGDESSPPLELDLGDSHFHCHEDGSAMVTIRADHQAGDPRHIPLAMDFAFAQQWARLGHACIHGALLEVDGAGVLVLGQRGAGKSVLASSALVAGGRIVSDDQILVGVRDGALVGERIRAFLSLRQSWAARTLFEGSNDTWRLNRSGNRAFLAIDAASDRFPDHGHIDHLWLLTRPRAGRQTHSTLAAISQAELFAALVTATQPLLLGPDFPHERRQLQDLFTHLLQARSIARLETGQDIVQNSKATWQGLLARAASMLV
ncbi:MAG TPA: hypothetical protein VFN29_09900 [Chiayiivirga sp.]|nr:hypothetical protein [Chiayiivirga sp.]